MKRFIFAVTIALLVLMPVFAHGGMDHILGTVTKISGDIIIVESAGKQTTVYLRDFTKYEAGDQVGSRPDLKVGDRVVIHAKKNKDNNEEAYDVRFVHSKK